MRSLESDQHLLAFDLAPLRILSRQVTLKMFAIMVVMSRWDLLRFL